MIILDLKPDVKYNFFAYTYGDEIEKKRIYQKDMLREKYSRINSESSARDSKNMTFSR